MRKMLLVAGLLFAALPSAASAGIAEVQVLRTGKYEDGRAAGLLFVAKPGERNDITVADDANGVFYVRDTGAPVTGGYGCVAIDAYAVRCRSSDELVGAGVYTEDLDDAVHAQDTGPAAKKFLVDGGEGADTLSAAGALRGGAGPDVLLGGAGADQLRGGAGDDILRGGGGDDTLAGENEDNDSKSTRFDETIAGDDVLDGGPGVDTVSYRYRSAGVRIDLADRGPAGGIGERDTLTAIEDLIGSEGPDVLSGDSRPNNIAGHGGDDIISGRGGHDALDDGGGIDTLYGGEGDDRLRIGAESSPRTKPADDRGDRALGESGKDNLTASGRHALLVGGPGADVFAFAPTIGSAGLGCGVGQDTLTGQLRGQLLAVDCEQVKVIDTSPKRRTLLTMPTAPTLRAATLRLPVAVSRSATRLRRCSGTLNVRLRRYHRRSLALGRRAFVIRRGARRVVRVTVPRGARAALKRAANPALQITLHAACAHPRFKQPFSRRWRVRLAARQLR